MCIVFAIAMMIVRLLGPVTDPQTSDVWGTYEGIAQSAPRVDGCTAYASVACSYTATHAGGIVAVGSPWRVTIERSGHTIEFTNERPAPLASVIRPGDLVTAETGFGWAYLVSDGETDVLSFVSVGSNAPMR